MKCTDRVASLGNNRKYTSFYRKPKKTREHLDGLTVNRRIILNMRKEYKVWAGLFCAQNTDQ
jgi:hypothetical protein